ncbi:MAG: hypothetical protein ACE5OS_06070 [Anaerolineae bacterium]
MDRNALTVLTSDVEAQMALIEDIFAGLERRAAGLEPDDEVRMESVAYQIHNLYNAAEDLLKITAAHFENQIADSARWHTALLHRMTQEITGVRPPLLSQETYRLLNSLRGFRHFFRHAYAAPVEYAQLQINLDKARQLRPRLREDVERFLSQLQFSPPD